MTDTQTPPSLPRAVIVVQPHGQGYKAVIAGVGLGELDFAALAQAAGSAIAGAFDSRNGRISNTDGCPE